MAYGGANFVSSLIKNGLIDNYHLFLNPAATCKGLPIFGERTNRQELALVKATRFDCSIVVLHCQPKSR